MEKNIKLTNNEKKVLKLLLVNSRTSDLEIGEKINVDGSSVTIIRHRLISKGIIKKYALDINYDKLGIGCYVLVFYSATNNWWRNLSEEDVKRISGSKYIVSAFRTNERKISYVVLYGFKDNLAANIYFNELERVYNEYLVIEKLFFLSSNNIIKNDYSSLIDTIDNKQENVVPNKNLFENLLKKRKNKIT